MAGIGHITRIKLPMVDVGHIQPNIQTQPVTIRPCRHCSIEHPYWIHLEFKTRPSPTGIWRRHSDSLSVGPLGDPDGVNENRRRTRRSNRACLRADLWTRTRRAISAKVATHRCFVHSDVEMLLKFVVVGGVVRFP